MRSTVDSNRHFDFQERRPISPSGLNTGSQSPYLALWAQYGLWLRLCARASPLRAYASAYLHVPNDASAALADFASLPIACASFPPYEACVSRLYFSRYINDCHDPVSPFFRQFKRKMAIPVLFRLKTATPPRAGNARRPAFPALVCMTKRKKSSKEPRVARVGRSFPTRRAIRPAAIEYRAQPFAFRISIAIALSFMGDSTPT